jgi:hypothetical protein
MQVKLLTYDEASDLLVKLDRIPELTTDVALREVGRVLSEVISAIIVTDDATNDHTLYLATDDGVTHITDDQGQDITVTEEPTA